MGLGVGIGTAIHAGARSSDADAKWVELYDAGGKSACDGDGGANKASCDELVAADADARTFRGISIASFAVGGAALVAAGVTLLAARETFRGPSSQGKRAGAVQVSVGLTPNGGGALVRGSF